MELATIQDQPKEKLALQQVLQLGKVLFDSGYFSDVKSASQAVVKILRGQELGIGAVTSLEQIHVIQGKTALSAGLIGSLIKSSNRYNYTITQHTDDVCEVVFMEHSKEIGRSKFTLADAEKAGLSKRDMWKQYPRNMLFARALSNGARWHCPDAFGGAVYTPEELQAIDVEVIPFSQAQQTSPPEQPAAIDNGKTDDDRFRRKVFAEVREFTKNNLLDEAAVDDAMKKAVGGFYKVDSRSKLTPAQWQAIAGNINSLFLMILKEIEIPVAEKKILADKLPAQKGEVKSA